MIGESVNERGEDEWSSVAPPALRATDWGQQRGSTEHLRCGCRESFDPRWWLAQGLQILPIDETGYNNAVAKDLSAVTTAAAGLPTLGRGGTS